MPSSAQLRSCCPSSMSSSLPTFINICFKSVMIFVFNLFVLWTGFCLIIFGSVIFCFGCVQDDGLVCNWLVTELLLKWAVCPHVASPVRWHTYWPNKRASFLLSGINPLPPTTQFFLSSSCSLNCFNIICWTWGLMSFQADWTRFLIDSG